MKVLLFTGFGSCTKTSEMIKIMNESKFPFNRVGKIVEFIEKTAIDKTGEDIFKTKEWLNEDLERIAACKEGNQVFYLIGNGDGQVSNLSIMNVDISRPWTIEEYDGSEYVKYLDGYSVVKELNYYNVKE